MSRFVFASAWGDSVQGEVALCKGCTLPSSVRAWICMMDDNTHPVQTASHRLGGMGFLLLSSYARLSSRQTAQADGDAEDKPTEQVSSNDSLPLKTTRTQCFAHQP